MKTMLKRGASMLMALVMCLSVLTGTGMTAFAATGDAGTITFARTYDSNGNLMRYNSSAVINGYTAGGSGALKYRMFVDGDTAFCIQPGVPLHTGDTLRESSSATWDALSSSQKRAVGLALLYGYQGNRGNLSGSDDEKWVATQTLVWEFVTGCRSAEAPYTQHDTTVYSLHFGSNYPNSGAKAAYDQIVSLLTRHRTVPSFMDGSSKELEYQDGRYTLTLTDSNGVLSEYAISVSDQSVSVEKSGNTLTISTEKAISGSVRITATRSNIPVVSESAKLIAYGDDSLQDVVTGVENAEPVSAYLNIETPTGSVTLKKTSEDGVVEGITFTVSGNGVNQTVTTNAAGELQINGLTPGVYTVTEQSIDRYEPQSVQRVTVIGGQTSTVTFNNVLKRGDLIVTKTSEDGLVEGMTFHLYGTSLSGLAVDEYATTDSSGKAYFNNVLIGTGYVLEEVDTPIRYVVPDSQTAAIEWNTVTNKSFTNVLKKWQATVTKSDGETGTAQGDASLAGAVYGIYKGDQLVDTYTTDESGQLTTAYYVCGDDWSIREISPSEGYLLDGTSYHVGAEAELYVIEYNHTSNDVTEQVIKGNISIIKHTDDGETQIETPEAGAEFSVYLKAAGSYDAAKESERDYLICDENGYAATKDLPYGIYTVHQVSGWEGRELMEDFDVYISSDGATYRYLINNANFESYLKIIKVDAETGKTIPYAGAGFQLYRPDGSLITQTFTYPEVTTIDTFYTNAEGYLITPETLEYGTGYSLVEVSAPYGYVLNSDPVYFDVTADNATEESTVTVVEVTKENMPQKGIIRIGKTGEVFASVVEKEVYQPVYAVQGLPGATYEITAAEDIYTPDGTLRASADEVVDTVTTDDSGMAESKPLYLGRYEIRETEAPYGMVLNTEAHTVELTYAGQEVEITETASDFYNERQKVAVSLFKSLEQDETFGIGMNGEMSAVTFALYAAEDLTAADGSVIPADGMIEILSVDADGYGYCGTDLPPGSYYLQELSTDGHYILSDEKYPVVFEYAGQDAALVQIIANDGEAIANDLIYGKISGLKVDRETEETIAGAVFGLFTAEETEFTEENAILTAQSGEDGIFTFENVPYGNWIVRELQPADGFLSNEESYPVQVTEDGEVIEITVINDRIPEIGTTATVNGEKEVNATEVFTLEDVVEYQHLIPGREYTLEGVLMDKATGEPLLVNGEEVRSALTFIPEEPSGSVTVTFSFDARYIKADTDIVAFESLYQDEVELAVHADIEDEGQTVTVHVPEIGTQATVGGKKEVTAGSSITIDDVVAYTNLTPGKEYTIEGILMDKATGGPFLVKEKEVRSEVTFTPETADGEVTVSFTFDGSDITKDTEIVVFETLYREGVEIAVHAEIEDADQTVTIRPQPPKTPDVPQTGDDSRMGFWLGLGAVALGGLVSTVIFYFKRKKDDGEE